MNLQFTSHQIKGKGRGKLVGFPTVNLVPPADFELEPGIYAAWVTVEGVRFRGAMHWGPIPTFEESQNSLEVFLMGLEGKDLSETDFSSVSIEVHKKIRDILKFDSIPELTAQIEQDVLDIRKALLE